MDLLPHLTVLPDASYGFRVQGFRALRYPGLAFRDSGFEGLGLRGLVFGKGLKVQGEALTPE